MKVAIKSEKGVGLTSLIIYIIILLVVVSVISLFTGFFYSNIDETEKNIDVTQEFTRFTSFLIEDINKTKMAVLECSKTGNEDYIVFSDGTQYTFINNSIYRGKVKICQDVYNIHFESTKNNGKDVVKVHYQLTQNDQQKTNTYALNS